VQLSPVLAGLAQYPFARLDDWKAEASARGIRLIDFGMGDPRERTPAFIREAMLDSVEEVSSYPRATGLPELRAAIAGWVDRRFDVRVDPDREILPTLGSKEAIYSFAQIALGEKRLVAIPEPAYPVYERGALFAGGSIVGVPLREDHGWLPDLDAFDAWDEIAVFWVCYPNNPTGAEAPLSFYEELAARAREHGFLLCSDEAYSELWFDEPPVSALQVFDRTNIVVFNTLSKRSSMTGYRSGFICAPAELTDALRTFRPTVGTAPQEFVQRASVAAWSDDTHVEDVRAIYRHKRETLLPALEAAGLRLAGSTATFYLWLDVGGPSEAFARRLLEHGVVCAPGSFFGPAGEGYVRFALVPTQEECERAAEIVRAIR
jgi:succinyldiaminopimelate transaminase